MSCGRSKVQPARCHLCKEPGHSSTACWGKGSQGLKPVLSGEAQRAHSSHMCDVCPCFTCPRGSQRETNSFKIRCAKQSSTCTFLTSTLAPGAQDQLGTSCAKASKTKTRSLLSWSPSELYLGIHLLSLFPQGTAPWQDQRGSVWVPLSCCTPVSLKKGCHIPESAALVLL